METLLRLGLPVGNLMDNFANMLMGEWQAESICADPRAFRESGVYTEGVPAAKMCRCARPMGVPYEGCRPCRPLIMLVLMQSLMLQAEVCGLV